jgi:ABC-type Fe3+ transport system permease subunit
MAVNTSENLGSLLSKALIYTFRAGSIAAIINTVLYLFVGIPINEFIERGTQIEHIGLLQVILASIIPAVGAGIVFAFIAKYIPNPFLIFNVIAALVFLLMFFSPFNSIQNASNKTLILLEIMHIVVGSAVLYTLNNIWGAPKK